VPLVSEFPEPVIPAAAVTISSRIASTPPQRAQSSAAPVPWSAPAAPRTKAIPEVAPIFDDEPGAMVEMSAYEDAAGISTMAKILVALAILVGIAGLIWGASFLFIWSKSRPG
jgi:hypothetical protein